MLKNMKIKYYKSIHDDYLKQAMKNNAYYLTGSKYIDKLIKDGDLELIKQTFSLTTDWDEYPTIPFEEGVMLEDLLSSEDETILSHKTYIQDDNILESMALNNILTEGIINNEDFKEKDNTVPNPTKTVTVCSGILSTMINIKSSYKVSNVTLLLKVPSSILNKKGQILPGKENEFYNFYDNFAFIKPEFIYRIIEFKNNKYICYDPSELKKEKTL